MLYFFGRFVDSIVSIANQKWRASSTFYGCVSVSVYEMCEWVSEWVEVGIRLTGNFFNELHIIHSIHTQHNETNNNNKKKNEKHWEEMEMK